MSEFNSYYGFLDKSPQGLRLSTLHWCYHLQCIRKGLLAESMDISFMDVLKLTVGEFHGDGSWKVVWRERRRYCKGDSLTKGGQAIPKASPTHHLVKLNRMKLNEDKR